MSISNFGRKNGESGSGAAPAAPAPSGPAALTAFIDQGSKFEGKLSFKDTVRIDGGFEGEISSENTLIVGESGEVTASIRSQTVVVSGLVTGNIEAARQVVLHKTAQIEGDITTPSLVVEEGAQVNGTLSMSKGKAQGSSSSCGLASASSSDKQGGSQK